MLIHVADAVDVVVPEALRMLVAVGLDILRCTKNDERNKSTNQQIKINKIIKTKSVFFQRNSPVLNAIVATEVVPCEGIMRAVGGCLTSQAPSRGVLKPQPRTARIQNKMLN